LKYFKWTLFQRFFKNNFQADILIIISLIWKVIKITTRKIKVGLLTITRRWKHHISIRKGFWSLKSLSGLKTSIFRSLTWLRRNHNLFDFWILRFRGFNMTNGVMFLVLDFGLDFMNECWIINLLFVSKILLEVLFSRFISFSFFLHVYLLMITVAFKNSI
jgi:hypothetical protein